MPVNSSKKVRITLVGQSGKMGTQLERLIEADPFCTLDELGDVVIDFSSPEGTKKAIALRLPLVCGTTGLSEETIEDLHTLSKKVPVLYCTNFSLGIHFLTEILQSFGKKLLSHAEASISETHHKEKIDSPSGTALSLAQILNSPPIASFRENGVVGIHQVDFLMNDEKLSFTHKAFDRKAFARGAFSAAKKIFNLPAKMYTLREIFR